MQVKHCPKCKQIKPVEAFAKSNLRKTGLESYCRLCQKEYRILNADKIRERKRKYYLNNIDDHRERSKKYYLQNSEKIKLRSSAWYIENIDRASESRKLYHSANIDKWRVYGQNRRARKKSSGGILSIGLKEKLFKLQKGKCACCKSKLIKGYHMDHIIPLALGGPNIDTNIQLLCKHCNCSKQDKHPIEFMQLKGLLL